MPPKTAGDVAWSGVKLASSGAWKGTKLAWRGAKKAHDSTAAAIDKHNTAKIEKDMVKEDAVLKKEFAKKKEARKIQSDKDAAVRKAEMNERMKAMGLGEADEEAAPAETKPAAAAEREPGAPLSKWELMKAKAAAAGVEAAEKYEQKKKEAAAAIAKAKQEFERGWTRPRRCWTGRKTSWRRRSRAWTATWKRRSTT